MRLACFGLLALFAATAHAEDKLLACVEDADYPPFTYFERTGDKQIPKGSTPAEMAALIRSEAEKWRKVIAYSGAKME